MYNIEGDNVKFYAKEGRNVKYWEYKYNLQNRLEKVTLNGKTIAEFLYDSNGNRVKTVEYKINPNKVEDIPEKINTTYFIYNYSKKVIMEEEQKKKKLITKQLIQAISLPLVNILPV